MTGSCYNLHDITSSQEFIFGWLFGAFLLGIVVAIVIGRLLHKIGEARLVSRLGDYDIKDDPCEIFHHQGP